jgi:transcriptional regulator with XRE-family HTH domain
VLAVLISAYPHRFSAYRSLARLELNGKPLLVAKSVGQALLELRELDGRSRNQVARKVGLDPSVLWRLENGEENAQPSFDLVRRVADTLGVTLVDVVTRMNLPQTDRAGLTAQDHLDRIQAAVEALSLELKERPGKKPAKKPAGERRA